MSDQQYLTTGEFAKACGVSKYTLFHYDEIGILQPGYVNEKGYRFYSVKQFYTYHIIETLQKAGTPLREIKEYLREKNPARFLSILKQKSTQLRLEQKKIAQMQRLLQTTYDMTESALQAVCDAPFVEECEEEYLIAVALSSKGYEKEDTKIIGEHFDYLLRHDIQYEYPTGVIISQSHLQQRIYNLPDYFYNKLIGKQKDKRLHIKPKGTYAVINHKGSYGTLPQSYEMLCHYIEEQRLSIIGNGYEQEILCYLAVEDPAEYIIRIAIHVG